MGFLLTYWLLAPVTSHLEVPFCFHFILVMVSFYIVMPIKKKKTSHDILLGSCFLCFFFFHLFFFLKFENQDSQGPKVHPRNKNVLVFVFPYCNLIFFSWYMGSVPENDE